MTLQQVIPLQAVPSQTLSVALGGQPCQIDILTKTTGLFVNLWLNGVLILAGALALNGVPIVRGAYLGFAGNLGFFDTQGAADPVWTGLGSRWLLGYMA